MTIAIDFDGTCVTHAYPDIGEEIGAAPVLKEMVKKGCKLILFTMRSNRLEREYLEEAVRWFSKHDIPLYGIQQNPTQSTWTSSPKACAEMYIDDAALGVPLKVDRSISDRPFVDWKIVRELLERKNVI